MSEPYTPTTEDVRDLWRWHFYEGIASDEAKADADWDDDRMNAQFDRCLAEFERKVAERAWDEAAHIDAGCHDCIALSGEINPYRAEATE